MTTRLTSTVSSLVMVLALAGCGGSSGEVDGDGGNGVDVDADPNAPDARPGWPEGCDEEGPECNNCIDDDEDGLIDGADPECVGPEDDREGSFATGIPGDNVDEVYQDCFFDGDSGPGNDGCAVPTCCLYDNTDPDCPDATYPPNTTCEPSEECAEYCAPLTPPGCDCFGCCTVCDGDYCEDIAVGLAGDDCTVETLDDEEACPRCTKTADCGEECDPDNCILCPGQTEDDLPEECEEQVCPGTDTCEANSDCEGDMYCNNGCCIHVID